MAEVSASLSCARMDSTVKQEALMVKSVQMEPTLLQIRMGLKAQTNVVLALLVNTAKVKERGMSRPAPALKELTASVVLQCLLPQRILFKKITMVFRQVQCLAPLDSSAMKEQSFPLPALKENSLRKDLHPKRTVPHALKEASASLVLQPH